MDKFLVINAVLASGAIFAGLYSHRFLAALAAWFWLSVVHSGLILLAMGQAGAMTAPELPMLSDALAVAGRLVDTGFQLIQVSFANAALVAYFVATVGILLGLVLAAFIIGSILRGLASFAAPQKEASA